jgi:CubicO group peptidase (beta-lactamase class C family)
MRFLFLSGLMILLSSTIVFGSAYGEMQVNAELSGQNSPENQERDTTEQAVLPSGMSDYIDGIIASQRREHKLSAVTVSVIQNDSLVFARGYGLSDIESNRPVQANQTLFRIGSVSKTFTWTAVMMLVEQGLLNLDADVNNYLNDVQIKEAFGVPVTMRHLMSHRAGFEDKFLLFSVADDDSRSLSELLSDQQPDRVYSPGQRTSYSNWGAALSAQIVEDVSGVSFRSYLQEKILTPLGMNSTVLNLPDTMAEDRDTYLTTGYKIKQGALDIQGYMQLGEYWPAGGMASTAKDMARWMQLHLNGGQLGEVQLMTAETHRDMWMRAYNDRPNGADVAHGFQDRSYRGLRLLGHGGGTAAFLTNMIMVPELNLGVFVSQNGTYGPSLIGKLPMHVIDFVHGGTYNPFLFEEASVNDLKELEGTYLNNRRVFSTFAAVLGLGLASNLTPVSDKALILSSQGASTYFQKVAGLEDVFENADGERLAVIRNDKGMVSALADGAGVHTLERVGFMSNPNTFIGSFALVLLLTFTTLLGTWRRIGQGESQGYLSRIAGIARFLAALSVLTFTAGVVYLLVSFADFDISTMSENYPSFAMLFTHYAGWLVAIMSPVLLAGLWPAWKGADWKLWRRLHYSVYAVSLLFFAVLLWQWRIIGAAVV